MFNEHSKKLLLTFLAIAVPFAGKTDKKELLKKMHKPGSRTAQHQMHYQAAAPYEFPSSRPVEKAAIPGDPCYKTLSSPKKKRARRRNPSISGPA